VLAGAEEIRRDQLAMKANDHDDAEAAQAIQRAKVLGAEILLMRGRMIEHF